MTIDNRQQDTWSLLGLAPSVNRQRLMNVQSSIIVETEVLSKFFTNKMYRLLQLAEYLISVNICFYFFRYSSLRY